MSKNKRKFKDSLFTSLFCEDLYGKRNFLDLYNALNGTQLKYEETKIEDVRIDGVLYAGQANDVSMLVDNKVVVLLEQQSTINENMPLRCLMYVSQIYEKILDSKTRFKRKLQKIPAPEFFVFYNGTENFPESKVLNLSEAFIENKSDISSKSMEKNQLNLEVMVYNINKPNGKAKWEECNALTEYSDFVRIVREEKSSGNEKFMDKAIRRAKKSGVLAEYLSRNAKEIENMFFGEYDYETDVAVQREEAFEDGFSKGESSGAHNKAMETAKRMLADGVPAEQVAKWTDIPVETLRS